MNEPEPDRIEVEISDTQGHLRPDHRALRAAVAEVLGGEGYRAARISLALVDDATIRPINRRHLGHDWATDVVSFPLSEPGDPVLAGELVLSAETARRAAEAEGADPLGELTWYLVHGLLHLCGFDDHSEGDRSRMRRREAEHLDRLAVAIRGRGDLGEVARCPA